MLRLAGTLLMLLPLGPTGCGGNGDRPPAELMSIVDTCTTCHGPDGKSVGAVPSLYGKSETEILRALEDFALGERDSPIMQGIVTAYSGEELEALAKYFGGLPMRDR